MEGLKGKNVLITDGTAGIGQAIAVRFAREGVNVAINYRKAPKDAEETEARVQECIHQVGQQGVQHALVQGDVSSEKQVEAMFERLLKSWETSIFWSTMQEYRWINLLNR